MTKAIMNTEAGSIELDLFDQDAPNTVQNFVKLAKEGYVVADVIADMWEREEDKLKVDKDAKRIFLKNEKAYKIGEIHKQEQLLLDL